MNDSPVGLVAWIIDKWWSWGALGQDLDQVFSRDELLTNVMIYWVSGTANASTRSYYERAHTNRPMPPGQQMHVPMGAALTLEQIQRLPRSWAERVYTDIRHWTEFTLGGHFTALEAPALLAADIRTFYRALRT